LTFLFSKIILIFTTNFSAMKIEKDILIEDLVEDYPFAEEYLRVKGIKCIRCGEPIWGTLEDACKEKSFSEQDIEQIVTELNEINKNQNNNEQKNQHTRSIDTTRLDRG